MRYKWAAGLCALLLILCLGWGSLAEEAREDSQGMPPRRGDILVIYPEEADKLSGEDDLSAIAKVLLSLRYSADFVEAEEAGPLIGEYDKVIWCSTVSSNRMDAKILQGYEGKLLVLGQAVGLEEFGLKETGGFLGSFMGSENTRLTTRWFFRIPSPF